MKKLFPILVFTLIILSDGYGLNRFILHQFASDTNFKKPIYYFKSDSSLAYFEYDSRKFDLLSDNRVLISPRFKTNILATEFLYDGYTEQEYFWILKKSLIKHVDFYQTDEKGNLIRFTSTGSEFPFTFRELENRYFIFKIQLQPDKVYRLYASVKPSYKTTLEINLFSKADFESWYETDNFILAAFLGFLVVCILLTSLFYLTYKDIVFLKFLIFLIPLLILELYEFGFVSKYLVVSQTEFNDINKEFFLAWIGIGFLSFAPQLIFPLADIPVVLKKIIRINIILFALVGLIYIFITHENFGFHLVTSVFKLASISAVVISLYSLWLSFKIKKWNKMSIYFLVSWSGFMLFPFLNFQFGTELPWLGYYFEISSLIQIVFLFLAFIYKHSFLLDEKYQLEISQLEEKLNRTNKPTEKYKNSKFSIEEVNEKYKELMLFMAESKPYLDEEINLN